MISAQFEFQFLCQPNPITLNHEKLRLGHKGNQFLPENSFTWISFWTITKRSIALEPLCYKYGIHREYFMESAGVRYLRTSCWHNRNQTSECSNWAKFLIQKQVCKYHTKHFHVVLCLLYTHWDSHNFGSFFISNLSKMLKFATTHCEMTMKSKYQPISKKV